MSKQLTAYIEEIFAPYKHLKSARELEEELLMNLTEKYNDYKDKGYNDEKAFKLTQESIGDLDELIETIDPECKIEKENRSVLPSLPDPLKNGIMAAYVYAILFVVLMVVLKGTITSDGIVVPAVILLGVVSLVQYIVKGNSTHPRWLVVGSVLIAVMTAITMAVILH